MAVRSCKRTLQSQLNTNEHTHTSLCQCLFSSTQNVSCFGYPQIESSVCKGHNEMSPQSEKIYIKHSYWCDYAACHKGGGNTVQPGATLSLGDMQRNGLLDVDAVYKVVYSGKGKMYGFGQGCAPKVCVTTVCLLPHIR